MSCTYIDDDLEVRERSVVKYGMAIPVLVITWFLFSSDPVLSFITALSAWMMVVFFFLRAASEIEHRGWIITEFRRLASDTVQVEVTDTGTHSDDEVRLKIIETKKKTLKGDLE